MTLFAEEAAGGADQQRHARHHGRAHNAGDAGAGRGFAVWEGVVRQEGGLLLDAGGGVRRGAIAQEEDLCRKSSLLLSLVTLIFGVVYPLTPPQITLIGAFTIGIPAFLLSQVPDHFLIRGHFMKNVILKALPGGITDVVVVIAMVLFGQIFGVSQNEIATASTILLSIVGIMVLRNISKPMSSYKWGILALCTAGLVICFSLFGWFFGTTSLSTKSILLCINFGIMADTFLRFIAYIIQGIDGLITKRSAQKQEK